MLLDMASGLHFEVRNALVADSGGRHDGTAWNNEQADLRGQFASAVVRDGVAMARAVDWFNDDANFKQAVRA